MNPHIGIDRDQYITENRRLVYDLVRKRYAYVKEAHGIDPEELHQVGMIGLIKAYDGYDPTGFEGNVKKFSTYAIPTIHGEIARFLRDYNAGPKFSRQTKEIAYAIRQSPNQFLVDCTDAKVIAERLGVPKHFAADAIALIHYRTSFSLDAELSYMDDTVITLHDQIGDFEDPTGLIFVDQFIKTLGERDQYILYLYKNGMSQKDIGEVIGVTQVQVSRIMRRIRKQFQDVQKEPVYA
jgi:RNA polymerase sigma factor (sigma-70 family)